METAHTPVLVVDESTKIYFGYIPGTLETLPSNKHIVLYRARRCLKTSLKDFLLLATKGPEETDYLSIEVPSVFIAKAGVIVSMTNDAIEKWRQN